jgi:hypothetical protein
MMRPSILMNSMRILKRFFLILMFVISSLQGITQAALFNDTLRPFGPGGYALASVCQDDSFYYAVGGLNQYQTNWQHMILKLDKAGNIVDKSRIVDPSTYYINFPYNSLELCGNLLVDCTQLDDSLGTRGLIIAYNKHTLDTIWTKEIAHPDTQYTNQPGADVFSELTTVTATPDGGFIFTGNYTKYCITGNIRSFLLKVDSTGNILWRRTYDDVTYLYSLALTPNGGYAFINRFGGISLVTTDSSGNILWSKSKPGIISSSTPADLLYDSSGGYICSVYFKYGGTTSTPQFGVNIFRIDNNTQQISFDKSYIPYHNVENYTLHEDLGITRLPDNSFVVYGSVWENPSFRGFILKLDQYADSVWCKNYMFGKANQGHCQLEDLLPTDDGGFLGVGFYVPNGGDIAAWMFKTDANGYVGFEQTLPLETSAIRVFPNPAKETIHIDLSTTQEATLLNVYNLSGQLVAVRTIQSPEVKFTLDLQGFDPGMYFFELLGESGRLGSGKFLKVE